MPPTSVRHRLTTPDGEPVRGRRLSARLVAPTGWLADATGEIIETADVMSGDDGWCELTLTPQSQIAATGSYYEVRLSPGNTVRTIVVPDTGPVPLVACLVDPATLTPVTVPPPSVFVLATDPRLADPRTPKPHAHPTSDVTGLDTALAGKVDTTDPRLADPRTPTPHAASHATGGSDPISPAAIGALDLATTEFLFGSAAPRHFLTDPTQASAARGATITIPTYEGSGVAVHPSIYFHPSGWNGWKYWMAMTPYPNADNTLENPSIVVSNDGTTWQVPAGLTNPVVPPIPTAGSYNSDPGLVLGPDDRLYMFYRGYDTSSAAQAANTVERLCVLSTANGVTWTQPQIVVTSDQTVRRLMAPTVTYEADTGRWVMYCVDIIPSPRRLVRMTAPAATGPWTAPEQCTITGNTGNPWHADIHRVGDEWHMLMQDGGSGGGDVWAAVSTDGLSWRAGSAFAARFPGSWDAAYYKSCFVPAFRNGVFGWDTWLGSALFNATGPTIGRTFVRFDDVPTISAGNAAVQAQTDVLMARAGIPPWLAGDAFARADAAGLGNADSGQAWTASIGTFTIAGKAAVPSAAANTRAYVETGVADHWVTVQVAVPANSTPHWVIARFVDANNYYRFGVTPALTIQIINAGVVTTLWTGAAAPAVPCTLGLRCVGSTLEAYRDGVKLASVIDATHTGTKAGIQAQAVTAKLRNFTVRTA